MSAELRRGYGEREPANCQPKDLPAMTPIAAYYVMVVTDHEREQRNPRYDSVVARTSLVERISNALESLFRIGRPAVTQPF